MFHSSALLGLVFAASLFLRSGRLACGRLEQHFGEQNVQEKQQVREIHESPCNLVRRLDLAVAGVVVQARLAKLLQAVRLVLNVNPNKHLRRLEQRDGDGYWLRDLHKTHEAVVSVHDGVHAKEGSKGGMVGQGNGNKHAAQGEYNNRYLNQEGE